MSARPNLALSAVSAADLLTQLRAIDITVPLVTEGRTKQHREQFMMARFLATLAETHKIAFPLNLIHSEKPDFLLVLDGVEVGVECVEAVPKEWYQIEVQREKQYPDAMIFCQRFKPGESPLTRDEKDEIASGRRSGQPWMPKAAKLNWIEAMLYFVGKKTAKLRQGNYSPYNSTWLLVRDEWPNPVRFYPQQAQEAAIELGCRLALLAQPAFGAVFIESGNQLFCYEQSGLTTEEIYDLWN